MIDYLSKLRPTSEEELAQRENKAADIAHHQIGMGREMFGGFRNNLSKAEEGACSLFITHEQSTGE